MITLAKAKGVAVILPPPSEARVPRVRKGLSADALYKLLRLRLETIPDHRGRKCPISLPDALMSAFALFALKDPSLLAFEERRNDANMRNLFGIARVPSDTHMREILDPVEPRQLRPLFDDVFRQLQRGKALEPFVFYKGCYLLSLDGTGYFSSASIHCDSCLEKVNKQTGEVTYQHQMLAAVLIHPDHREVIPLAPEPIEKQDGTEKNDCERNAAKRLLRHIRQEHPHLKLIVVEDGLASNAPHIRELQNANMHFLLGAKPGDHPFLFDHVLAAFEADRVTTISWTEGEVLCEISFINGLPLNEANQDLQVNFLQYGEYGPDGAGADMDLGDRPGDFSTECPLAGEGGTLSLEDRERNLQHAQEPGLPLRTQLRPRREELVGGLRHVDDVGVPRGSGATTLLPAVPSGMEESGNQAGAVGAAAVALLALPVLSRCSTSTKSCSMIWPRNSRHRR